MMSLFNQSSHDEQTVCLYILLLSPLLHPTPSPTLLPSNCPALPNALDTQGLGLLFPKKKPQHIEKNQDVFALLDHAEKDLFLVVAGVILTTTTDKLMKSNAEIFL